MLLVAVTSFVASVVAVVTVVATITSAVVAVTFVVVSLLTGLLCLLRLPDLFKFDFSLSLDILILGLEFGPAQFLVLEHVKQKFLDTLTDDSDTFFGGFRVILNLLKLGNDTIVVFLGNLALATTSL